MNEVCDKTESPCIHRYIRGYDDGHKDGYERALSELELVKAVWTNVDETTLMNYEEFKKFKKEELEELLNYPIYDKRAKKQMQHTLDNLDHFAEVDWNEMGTDPNNTAWRKV